MPAAPSRTADTLRQLASGASASPRPECHEGEAALCTRLGVSGNTLREWRKTRHLPIGKNDRGRLYGYEDQIAAWERLWERPRPADPTRPGPVRNPTQPDAGQPDATRRNPTQGRGGGGGSI